MDIIKGIFGYVSILGYMLFESILFGLPVWLTWNITLPNMFDGVHSIAYIQGIALVLLYKTLTFNIKQFQPPQSK